jgi:AraC-like DNA-binding protein
VWSTSELLLLLAASHLTLLAWACLRHDRRDPSALASAAFIGTAICHMLAPVLARHGAGGPLLHFVVLGGAAVPFAFWVLARVHFGDDFRFRWPHGAVLVAFLSFRYVAWWVVVGGAGTAGLPLRFWIAAPRLLSLVFVVHALLDVYVGSRSDLLVDRVKLRFRTLGVTGAYVFVELLSEAALAGSAAQPLLERFHALSGYVLVFGICTASMLVAPELLRPSRTPAAGPALDPRLGERLADVIERQQIFREEGLTISGLAARLDAQEHKVRQLVNAQLGFRNFNAFLNHYRIREAKKTLADPAKAHLGVAQVAYEVGYRSLGPFNKAFKELTGQTPSEFRSAQTAGKPAPIVRAAATAEPAD